MPIYVYKCRRCDRPPHEEIQKIGDGPPVVENCPAGAVLEHAKTDELGTQPERREPCDLERVLTTAGHRFAPENSSEGLGGWTRQGEALIRQHRGAQCNNYGDSSTGKT